MIRAADLYKKLGLALPPLEAILGHEDNPGEKILVPLLKALGYDPITDIDRKPSLKHSIIGERHRREPDFGVLPRQVGERKQFAMVVDSKPVGEDLAKWVEKLAGYCGLAGAVRGVLVDGQNLIIIEPTRGVVEWKPHEEIPRRDALVSLVEREPVHYDEQDIVYAARITEAIDERVIEDLARRCHEIIRSRKGMAVPQRLYEFSKLLVARIMDERRFAQGFQKQLYLSRTNIDELKAKGASVKQYVDQRFQELEREAEIFKPDDSIDLPGDVIEDILGYLDEYQLWSRHIDILGQVYEKFLANTMTGRELGQYFTPRPVVETIVQMVDPDIESTILDPACGTGGFLIHALGYLIGKHNLQDRESIERVAKNLHGLDIFADVAKLCQVNLWLHGDSHDNIHAIDTLDPNAAPPLLKRALASPETHGFKVILTNPPFGATGGNLLSKDYVRHICDGWRALGIDLFECAVTKSGYRNLQPKSAFVELCLKALRKPAEPGEGGRLGIVVDNGLLSNMTREDPDVRDLIKTQCIIEAIVGMPKGTFKPYGSNVIPCFLILRRKHPHEKQGWIFRAEVSKVGLVPGIDRYRKNSHEDLQVTVEHWRRVRAQEHVRGA